MRIAVATWQGRISPVFDTARRIQCFHVANGIAQAAGETELTSDQPQGKIKALQELGASVLICGAISHPLAAMVSGAGIRLAPFLAGDVERVVVAFISGEVNGSCFHMPGCCGRGRRRRGRFGRNWEAQL